MIRACFLLLFWGLSILLVGPPLVLFAYVTGNVNPLYYGANGLGILGARLVGMRIEVRGRENLVPGHTYIFLANHVSNLDPPALIPNIPGRCSVLVKKELFRVPILGIGMRLSDLVPVDRSDHAAAIESVNAAILVLKKGLHLVSFPEGTRSPDGRLLPFKKGPFHLAMDSGVPIVPVTILGTYEAWPKNRFSLRPGLATVIFHPPVDPRNYSDRETLLTEVENIIASALPQERRGVADTTT